jgi:hypothetical protein
MHIRGAGGKHAAVDGEFLNTPPAVRNNASNFAESDLSFFALQLSQQAHAFAQQHEAGVCTVSQHFTQPVAPVTQLPSLQQPGVPTTMEPHTPLSHVCPVARVRTRCQVFIDCCRYGVNQLARPLQGHVGSGGGAWP